MVRPKVKDLYLSTSIEELQVGDSVFKGLVQRLHAFGKISGFVPCTGIEELQMSAVLRSYVYSKSRSWIFPSRIRFSELTKNLGIFNKKNASKLSEI
jgi:hypothetical protein